MVRNSSICSIELTKRKLYSPGAHKICNRDNIIAMAVMYKQLLIQLRLLAVAKPTQALKDQQ